MKEIEIYRIINDKGNYFLIELLSDNPKDERSLFCIGLSSESKDLNDSKLLTCRKINNNKLTFLNMLSSENYSIKICTTEEKNIIIEKIINFKENYENDEFKSLYYEMNNTSKVQKLEDQDIDTIDKAFYEEIGKNLGNQL